MKDREHEKRHFHSKRTRAQTPPRVAARLEGKVKNRGTKPKRKPKKRKSS
jgi:hypothetical protein